MTTKTTKSTRPAGKKAAAAVEASSIARIKLANDALNKLMRKNEKGEVGIVDIVRYISGKFPLLRREVMALLLPKGFNAGTVSTQFQKVRSKEVEVPKIDL